MSKESGSGIGQSSWSFSLGKLQIDEDAQLAAATAALLDSFVEPTAEEVTISAAAVGAAATLGGALALTLPLAFDVDVPEIALPAKSGSSADVEGDEETIETFNALQASSDAQASMGDAVFQTLDPILNGIRAEDDPAVLAIYEAADKAISDAGIDDKDTVPPIPYDGNFITSVVPSIARMQLFDEIAYAFRRSGMAAGAEDPEAPGKILAAYIALAVEKFVRRAIIKVSLPDDNYIKLLSELTTFGTNAAASAAVGSPNVALTTTVEGGNAQGSYTLDSADMMLGVNVVPLLNFYGGIKRVVDYGDNFVHDGYVDDGAEAKMVNMDAILLMLENGINFV